MARKAGSHADITGPKVRAAARSLIARYGYAAVSMRQIAAEVGVQAGALYTYTTDKQTLLFDLMREHMEEVIDSWSREPQGGDPLERLERFTRYHISHHLDRREEIFVAYMELRNLTPENFDALEKLRKRYENKLQAILISGQEAGLFQVPNSKIATMALIAMLNGVTTWFRDDGALSREEIEALYWDMVRRAVGV